MTKTYTAYNIRIILVLTLGSFTFGYAYSVISNTLGQPGFISYFDIGSDSSYANAISGAINGLFSAGGIFGALSVGWMCEAHGRKKSLYLGALVTIVGGVIQTASVHIAMFLVARFITGFGIGVLVVLIPIYQAEISPPNARGFLVGQHGTWIVTGYAIAGWVGVGTFYSTNLSFQWRFPIALSCLPPVALLCCSPWVPESPRWLLTRNQEGEAWTIISKLHGNADDHEQTYAREEFYQMTQQVQSDSTTWGQGGLLQLFTKPSYRKRMWMGFFLQYAAQTTGAMVVYGEYCGQRILGCKLTALSVYVVQLYKDLGESGGIPLVLGAAYVTVAAMSNFIGSLILDRVGRIPLLVTGLAGCMLSLALETAMVAQFAGTSNHAGNALGVLFTFCFITFYGGGIDVTSYVYCSEIFPTHIRSQGMAWSIVGTFLSTVVYVEAGPTALANIQWRYYLIFIVLTFFNIIIIWRWCPETKGLSLEEINGHFGDEVVIHFVNATEKQRASLEATMLAGGERRSALVEA